LQALDPHSNLLVPEAFKEFRVESTGSFGGLGMVVGIREGQLTVVAPLEGTPAYKAGLKAKDRIIQIENESTINMPLTEAVEKLRGPKGTPVSITIMREGFSEPKEYTLIRDIIKIESVEAHALGGGIGYVKVKNFQGNTANDLEEKVYALRKNGGKLQGLILDLRNNPGGLLDQAIDVSDFFLDAGTIVTTVGAGNRYRKVTTANNWKTEKSYPLIVLVNEGSASGSEIVAGALKHNHRALVIGNQTFGKGSVQQIYNLPDNSALKLTVAKYLMAGDISIQSIGVTPDILALPVVIAEKGVQFFQFQAARKEKDLKKSFNDWGNTQENPLETIRYYLPQNSDERLEVELSAAEKGKKLEEDFLIRLAKKLIQDISSWEREPMLRAMQAVLKHQQAEEDEAIIKALRSAFGIDWTLGPKGNPPIITTAVRLNKEVVKGGEELEMTITVTNKGGGTLYRLSALTESENISLANKEFIWGKIQPGESKSWTVSLPIPKSTLSHTEDITVKFQEYYQHVPPDLTQVVTIQGLPRPKFAYTYQLVDNGSYQSQGNGDGMIQRREIISLRVQVQNQGPGLSTDGVVSLRNNRYEEVFIKQGRVKVGDLPAGGENEVVLTFQVRENFQGENITFDLSLVDPIFNETLLDKVTLAVLTSTQASVVPSLAVQRRPPSIHFSEMLTGNVVMGQTIPLSGIVTDDGGIHDLSIFVNGDKVFFQSNRNAQSPEGQSLHFSTLVPLKAGNNLISVIARDDGDLIARESFMIRSVTKE
jgi:carboxyl-terminal processing protease